MLVMVAVWLPVLALFVSFAVDIGHFFDYSRNLQNRADATVLAAGDQLGNMCADNPTDPTTSPELAVGQMAQLFSGPPGSSSDLPYAYNSPLTAFPSFGGYQNVPNLTVSNGANGANYHVLLNADNYATAGGTNFAMGDFCHGDPTLDQTDRECYGQTNLQGQLADDCATGAMVDAKVTQGQVPLFFPLLGFRPNITAHARVAAQGIGSSTSLKPLGVEDPGVVPCAQVKFIPTAGSTATQTVRLTVDSSATQSSGPIIWNNGTGTSINIPSGANLKMQAILYAPGSDGTCATVGAPLTYETTSGKEGILLLNSYGKTLPTAGQPPAIVGDTVGDNAVCASPSGTSYACGVTLVNSTCTAETAGGASVNDQYFSYESGSCTAQVCAVVAFTPGAPLANDAVTVNGQTITTPSTDTNCQTDVTGATAWLSSPITINPASGQTQFTLGWQEQASGVCGSGTCSGTFGVQQQTFAACNENFNSTCGGSPNISGPIVQATISETTGTPGTTYSTIGSFQGGTSQNLVVTLALQGLQDSPRTDRCANGPTECTLLRVDQGNADGMVDCGEGNSAANGRLVVLYGCPLYGQTATTTNPVVCTNTNYCGGWQVVPTGTPDGVCNNATRTATTFVDCVNTNNQGATMPGCIQALVVSAGGNGGVVDYNTINPKTCHVTGSTCSEDKWLTGAAIDPTTGTPDPRIITTFIVYQGDISGATGNHDMQIRTFASFYVTGWKVHGGQQVNCGTFDATSNPGGNEPPPSTLPANSDAIWGHWITYTEPGAGGNGKPCNYNAFGDCAVVLTR